MTARNARKTEQPGPRAGSEHHEQVALFAWARLHEKDTPELALLFAVPNGALRPYAMRLDRRGQPVRYSPIGQRLAAEGLKRGVPDVWLPVPRGRYHGLVLEMKWGRNRPTAQQTWWLGQLTTQGWCTAVCWSTEAAIGMISDYLALKGTP